jgi:hypothetical protein
MMHKVTLHMFYGVTRSIDLQVEADSLEEAIAKVQDSDDPAWEDPRWVEIWELEDGKAEKTIELEDL